MLTPSPLSPAKLPQSQTPADVQRPGGSERLVPEPELSSQVCTAPVSGVLCLSYMKGLTIQTHNSTYVQSCHSIIVAVRFTH